MLVACPPIDDHEMSLEFPHACGFDSSKSSDLTHLMVDADVIHMIAAMKFYCSSATSQMEIQTSLS